jgi:hypothetical protein
LSGGAVCCNEVASKKVILAVQIWYIRQRLHAPNSLRCRMTPRVVDHIVKAFRAAGTVVANQMPMTANRAREKVKFGNSERSSKVWNGDPLGATTAAFVPTCWPFVPTPSVKPLRFTDAMCNSGGGTEGHNSLPDQTAHMVCDYRPSQIVKARQRTDEVAQR